MAMEGNNAPADICGTLSGWQMDKKVEERRHKAEGVKIQISISDLNLRPSYQTIQIQSKIPALRIRLGSFKAFEPLIGLTELETTISSGLKSRDQIKRTQSTMSGEKEDSTIMSRTSGKRTRTICGVQKTKAHKEKMMENEWQASKQDLEESWGPTVTPEPQIMTPTSRLFHTYNSYPSNRKITAPMALEIYTSHPLSSKKLFFMYQSY
ncbi:hypothetical protein CR513_50171, partial [Mucuna pruriens]